jgi:hypothetical protein
MKPRHAAALALVGWYLMMPPIRLGTLTNGQAGYTIASSLPFSEWSNFGSFDSVQKCDGRRMMDIESAKHMLAMSHLDPSKPPDQFKSLKFTAPLLAQCIASDDPRLKAN